jgi:Ca-activated chloride channel family protein
MILIDCARSGELRRMRRQIAACSVPSAGRYPLSTMRARVLLMGGLKQLRRSCRRALPVWLLPVLLLPFQLLRVRARLVLALPFLALPILALAAFAPLTVAAQQPPLRMDVNLVNVFVSVTGRNGAPVSGLTRDDFALAEDGRPQRIAIFERSADLPLNLTLAIDTSGSVRKDMAAEARAAGQFARALLGPQDQMSLLQFSSQLRELAPFTNQVKQIDRGLQRLRPGSATALYDAIRQASGRLAGRPGRKVLVLVSDGDNTAGEATYAQALQQALRDNVMIYAIIDVPIAASAGRDLGGEHALIALAGETGGRSFYESAGGLDEAFQRVGDDLRAQYLLGYYPVDQKPGEAFHRIQVTVVTVPGSASPELQIRHRPGYYADAQGGSQ